MHLLIKAFPQVRIKDPSSQHLVLIGDLAGNAAHLIPKVFSGCMFRLFQLRLRETQIQFLPLIARQLDAVCILQDQHVEILIAPNRCVAYSCISVADNCRH